MNGSPVAGSNQDVMSPPAARTMLSTRLAGLDLIMDV